MPLPIFYPLARQMLYFLVLRGRKPKAMTFTRFSSHHFPKCRFAWRNGNLHRLSLHLPNLDLLNCGSSTGAAFLPALSCPRCGILVRRGAFGKGTNSFVPLSLREDPRFSA